jgi:SAM-dependent methyltransferase
MGRRSWSGPDQHCVYGSALIAQLNFGPAELARVTGCAPDVAALAFDQLRPPDLIYRPLSEVEAATAMAAIDDVIRGKPLRVAGADDPDVWERGWSELASQLEHQQITTQTLRPQYFHAAVPCRLFGTLVEQVTPNFEYWVGLCVRFATFAEFLRDRKHIVEFGCGTGINLLLLAELLPAARLVGCDWATPSQKILAQMARESGKAIEGHRFNMLMVEGDCGGIDIDTAVLTVHALEQLGSNWGPILEFLGARRAGIYLHLEPLLELYDSRVPLDELARRYHLKRNYLQGFVPTIQKLAENRQAEILALRRVQFAGLYHEAYSVMVWRWTERR